MPHLNSFTSERLFKCTYLIQPANIPYEYPFLQISEFNGFLEIAIITFIKVLREMWITHRECYSIDRKK
ncbi:hypothetical protein [Candidatus Harpocratesius sp.]